MSFKELVVWRRSARLSADLYRHLVDLRDFGFRDQITPAGLSVPSNIAEGYGRGSTKETLRFRYYAKGSCAELQTQLYIGMEIGYIDREIGRTWVAESEELAAMLGALIKTKQHRLTPDP